jgi:hypothetical protein
MLAEVEIVLRGSLRPGVENHALPEAAQLRPKNFQHFKVG